MGTKSITASIMWRWASMAAGLVAFTCVQAQASKWVDDEGVVHYGDSVPQKFKGRAKVLPLRSDSPSASQAREAQLRLEGYRAARKPASKASETAESSPTAVVAPEQSRAPSCDVQWREFREAQDCFGPYRNANGSIKIEAFGHCPEIKQPVNCPAPGRGAY